MLHDKQEKNIVKMLREAERKGLLEKYSINRYYIFGINMAVYGLPTSIQ
jgi:hypothetical protein